MSSQKSVERTTIEKDIQMPQFRSEERFGKWEARIILASFPILIFCFFLDFLRSL